MRNIERFHGRKLGLAIGAVSMAYVLNFGIDSGIRTVNAGPCNTPVAGKTPCDSDKQLADARATQTAIAKTATAIATEQARKDKEVADLEAKQKTPTPSSFSIRLDKDGFSISVDIDNNITIPPQYLYGPDKVLMTREELRKLLDEGIKAGVEDELAKGGKKDKPAASPPPYPFPTPAVADRPVNVPAQPITLPVRETLSGAWKFITSPVRFAGNLANNQLDPGEALSALLVVVFPFYLFRRRIFPAPTGVPVPPATAPVPVNIRQRIYNLRGPSI